MVSLNFNARNVAPNTMPEPLPTGVYDVIITKTEEKPTKNRDGFFTEITMKVQGGEFNGRSIVDRLNLKNKNPQAVEIAYGTLSSICHVIGRLEIQDTQQLHGVPFKVSVIRVARDDRPGAYSNEVQGYKDINGNDPGMGGNVGAQGGQQAPSWAGGQGGGQPNTQQQGNNFQTQQPNNNGGWDPNAGQQQNPNNYQQQPNSGQQQFQDPNAGQNWQGNNGGQQPNNWQGQGGQQGNPNQNPYQGQPQNNGGGNPYQGQNNGGQQFNGQQNMQQGQQPNNGGGQYPAQMQNPNAGGPSNQGDAPAWVTNSQ